MSGDLRVSAATLLGHQRTTSVYFREAERLPGQPRVVPEEIRLDPLAACPELRPDQCPTQWRGHVRAISTAHASLPRQGRLEGVRLASSSRRQFRDALGVRAPSIDQTARRLRFVMSLSTSSSIA